MDPALDKTALLREVLAALKTVMDGVSEEWLLKHPNKGLNAFAAIRRAEGLLDAERASAHPSTASADTALIGAWRKKAQRIAKGEPKRARALEDCADDLEEALIMMRGAG